MDPHYPRPDFDRSHSWLSLDGRWDFAPDPYDLGICREWFMPGQGDWCRKITVPFAWETAASGVEEHLLPVGWYRRHFQAPADWNGGRCILNLGAVHYHCTIWVNSQLVGEHTGGYLPFALDVTQYLVNGAGELVMRVEAPIDKQAIPHGKQRSLPKDDYDGCSFTPTSGIWQPVWLEERPVIHVEQIDIKPLETLDGFAINVRVINVRSGGTTLRVSASTGVQQTIEVAGDGAVPIVLPLDSPRLWSPEEPQLYEFAFQLETDTEPDTVRTYAGLRSFKARHDGFYLNGCRVYLYGTLDQGYWPGSGYTAPHPEAYRTDVECALDAGFNMVRKHLKLEDPRWLYWADRLGLLVWEEPPCVSRYSREAIARFNDQLPGMIARDSNHPSIIIWGLYNEEWGLDGKSKEDPERQASVAQSYELLKTLDPSRPIVDDSGWHHVSTDIADWHHYETDMARWMKTTALVATRPTHARVMLLS